MQHSRQAGFKEKILVLLCRNVPKICGLKDAFGGGWGGTHGRQPRMSRPNQGAYRRLHNSKAFLRQLRIYKRVRKIETISRRLKASSYLFKSTPTRQMDS